MFMSAAATGFVLLPRADRASPSIEASTAAAHGPSSSIAMHTKVSVSVILLRIPGIQTSARQLKSIVTARTRIQSSRVGSRYKRRSE